MIINKEHVLPGQYILFGLSVQISRMRCAPPAAAAFRKGLLSEPGTARDMHVERNRRLTDRSPTEMADTQLQKFAGIIQKHRSRLLKEWRDKVRLLPAARNLDTPTLNDHIPHLFDELTLALTAGKTEPVLDTELL